MHLICMCMQQLITLCMCSTCMPCGHACNMQHMHNNTLLRSALDLDCSFRSQDEPMSVALHDKTCMRAFPAMQATTKRTI